MRIAGINYNDFVNGEGVCVSLFVQGCPHHYNGCFIESKKDLTLKLRGSSNRRILA